MNNKRLGTAFEREFCELLANRGFWVHFMTPSAKGSQPCDIIACKDDVPFLFDCKTSESKVFRINRVEDNQRFAFERFIKCGNFYCFFAVKHDDKIYVIPWLDIVNHGKIELNDDMLIDVWRFML